MKKALSFIFLIHGSCVFGQINLVENYSFENSVGTLECYYGPTANFPNSVTHDQEDLEDYWAELPPWTVPKMGLGNIGAGSSDHFCDGGNTGDNYGSGTNREYICAPLNSPVQTGHRYYVEFYIKSSGTLIDAGLRFSNERPKQSGYLSLNIDGQPQFEIDNAQVFSYSTWSKVSGYYVPDDNYSWITIGTFEHDKNFQSTFAIDDIKIVEWVEDCPTFQLLENWNFSAFITGHIINADDKLYAGYDVGIPNRSGNVVVALGGSIGFKAGNEVGLFDGFSAEYGCEFHAYNAPCGSDCFTPTPVAGTSTVICDGAPYQLGGDASSGYSYVWVSDPQNAIAYLSSTTVAGPVFTPPSGEGDITYYVIATNNCGQFGSNAVTIHYDDTPSAVAQFTVNNLVLGDAPSFDLGLNPDIELVTIEVMDASLNTIYYQENFHHLIDFQCCLLQWGLSMALSPCIDYKIRVTATNYCTGATAVQIIDWNRNRTFALLAPIPNIITPNDDGINDWFGVSFTGASQISFEVHASSGVTVFYELITAYPAFAWLWDGECNQPTCVNGPLEDGTYFYILKFYDCSGTSHDYTGFVTLLNGGMRMQLQDSLASEIALNPALFPNPTSGNVIVSIGAVLEEKTSVIIYNSLGQIIEVNTLEKGQNMIEFDLSQFPCGIYFAQFVAKGEFQSLRFAIEKME